jgi:hypothetical protein
MVNTIPLTTFAESTYDYSYFKSNSGNAGYITTEVRTVAFQVLQCIQLESDGILRRQ